MTREQIDHRQRAIDLHRRAQRAEAEALHAKQEAAHWKAAWLRALGNRNTLRRRLRRARAKLQAARMSDAMTHIIELGRLFP